MGQVDIAIDFDPEFAEDSEPTDLVCYFRVQQIVGGVATREATFVHEYEAHDVADVWRAQRHTLPSRVDIVRIYGRDETIVARYGAPDETAPT